MLGIVTGESGGYLIRRSPDTMKAPDVGFVRKGRAKMAAGFFEGSPDLAVEVVSPGDAWSEVMEKGDEWLAAGTESVWIVDPRGKRVVGWRKEGRRVFEVGEAVEDEVLPELKVEVGAVFG